MLVSFNWLKEYVQLSDISAIELAERLTRSGVAVDIVHPLNKGVKNVVVGHVVKREQHPDADKLSLCQVDVGEEELVQIVCGAKNVAEDQKVAVAKVGAVLPGNFKIKKAKLRGQASHGMICSLQELGVDTKFVPKEVSEGIFVFPQDVEVGIDALQYLNLDDEVLELDLTPNRADCLNMIGVAYEVGAILSREIDVPTPKLQKCDEKAADFIEVRVDAIEDNPIYRAMVIKDVKVGPSPLWLQNRLMAAGIRPISNVVDITNYVLLEYGQPLHAFDYARFGSKEIVVRKATEGEEIVTLDDATRKLAKEHLVITNGKEPVAVAGVMGGAKSEVNDETTTVLLEAAYFKGSTVRKASKDLGLRSDSSVRFEKGIDPNRVALAAERAAQMICELAGGVILEGCVEVNELDAKPLPVDISVSRLNDALGTELTAEVVGNIFKRLQFIYSQNEDIFTVYVPTRRPDITIEADLVEEVARLYGYDHIPTTLPIGLTTAGALTPSQTRRRNVRRYLESVGLNQTITYSLTSSSKAKGFGDTLENVTPIRLAMPMSEDRSTLRTSLIPHVLDVVQYNHNRKIEDIAIYEVGSIFLTEETEITKQPTEKEILAGAFTGTWQSHLWQGEKKKVDFFVAKGVLEGLFDQLGITEKIRYASVKKDSMHPGRTAAILLDGEEIGFVGQIHPTLQKELDLNETYIFQLDLQVVLSSSGQEVFYEGVPKYPAISRDIALVVAQETQAEDVKDVIKSNGGKLLKSVQLFDLYQGEKMEEGHKSLAFSLTYFDPEKTLTDEEVTNVHNKVLEGLKEKLGVTLRA
ncbi:phenylalanine--tRNA ligase subunit beta [Anaerobacillus arseniciselenatis]|uniref:Phenylalanine--tRNA ligase beta subunit n=1 Tax=Anaerobacillus arseniciselenatis TaxID=85682 RepID=A0A1S2LF25_9BACI|nr:phenylalanine--tRNA ligase subunit beta [Anaerobacillus arseniciselenatis]OIJ10991.1 phenylalanine--tRNA ligase subunit beta [Anaerobacillus arseniciselenatis]